MLTRIIIKYFDLIDKVLPVGGIVRRFPYAMVFKTTNWCWYKCAHCCENAGPDQPHEYIPSDIIKYYIQQGINDPTFSQEVVFTGGEIMSAYKFGDEKYVRDLLTFCGQNNIGTDIKTNAGWVKTSFAPRIYDDLADIISNNAPYQFQISLSLDRFHPNSLENCAQFIKQLSRRPNMHTAVHLSSFGDDAHMYPELLKTLMQLGVRINSGFVQKGNKVTEVDIAGKQLVLKPSADAVLFSSGRAKNLPNAAQNSYPQFKFLTRDARVLMAFDSFGRVTLGENADKKISAQWRASNGTPRPLNHIQYDLIKNAQWHEIRARIFDHFSPFSKQK